MISEEEKKIKITSFPEKQPLHTREVGFTLKSRIIELFARSAGLSFIFYTFLGLVIIPIIVVTESLSGLRLIEATFWLLGGSLFIALTTQVLHLLRFLRKYKSELRSHEDLLLDENLHLDNYKSFVYEDWVDCFVRCSSGLLEVLLYTVSFAISAPEIVVGYLIMKTLSLWKSQKDPKEEGISTSVLRIAIVMSILLALKLSYYAIPVLEEANFPFY